MRYFISIILFLSTLTLSAQKDSLATVLKTADSVAVIDGGNIIKGKSVVVVDTAKTTKQRKDWSKWRPSAKKATWLALIPGAGQIYNRKYWKLPLFYGGFLGCIYAWRWNGQMYQDYKQAYEDLKDDDPTTKSYESFLHLGVTIDDSNKDRWISVFKNRRDIYRRYRDLSIFCLIAVYGLSIIDAYVDASLSEFDISDDLSLKISPAVMNSNGGSLMTSRNPLQNSAVGVNCSLKF